ncbi:MAG: DUF4886 domain-containing protein [Clostridia bacterium]|nr:DUF4886 domain-containing protein [Clostridia bacterium]
MKKFLRIVSLMLVMAMLLPMTPIEIFAVESEQTQTTPTVNADGTKTYTVNGYKTAIADGSIGADEYTFTTKFTDPVAYSSSFTFDALSNDYSESTRVADEVSINVSHDESKIYIGVLGKGTPGDDGNGVFRDGYTLRLGFNPAQPQNYIGIALLETGASPSVDANDSTKMAAHDAMAKYDTYQWSSASRRGLVRSNGSFAWDVTEYSNDPYTGTTTLSAGYDRTVYNSSTEATYPVDAMIVSKQTVDGSSIDFGSGHGRTAEQVYTYWEIEFDKQKLLDFYNHKNDTLPEGYQTVENLDTMLFAVGSYFGLSPTGEEYRPQVIWNGTFDDDVASKTHALEAYNFDTVEFKAPVVEENPLGGEFATSTHDTSLTELKQDIYSTGLKAYKVNEGDIDATDGVIDDEYVKVTPDAVDHGPSHTYMQYTSNKGWNGQSNLEIRNDWDAYAALLPDINYYVAQSDSHIYLVVKEDVPYIAEGITVTGTESKVYSMNDWGYWFYRLGFNPNDYTQQICIDNNTQSWFTASWIADNNNKYDISSAGVMTSWARANTNYAEPRTQAWSRVSEIKLSKEAIKSVYSTNFGVTLTDEDLATMFIAVSCQLYARRDNDYSETSSETNDRIGNPIYGVFTAESVASSENNVIPDVIVFGNEKSGLAFASCSFTGHSTEARYLVEGTTDTYYHACTHCGMAGAATFKVVDDALVYDKEIVSEDTEIVAATCTSAGKYYKSCSCGIVSKSEADTFNYIMPHDFTAKVVADKYEQKAPTCMAGGIYYVSCKVCGESTEGTTAEDTFTTPSTLWPEGAVKPVYHGQRTFYTGDNYTVNDSDIKLNATGAWEPIEEGFVKVNSEPIKATISNKLYSNKGLNQTGVTITSPEDFEMYPITPTFDYYVAKSDTTIYIVFDMIYHPDENGIGTNATKNVWTSDYYKYFRLGFNPEDYTQQIVFRTRGHGLSNDSQKGTFYVADVDSATQLWTGYNYDSPYYDYAICGQGNNQAVTNHRIRKYAFNIEDMKELYLEQFGVTLTDEDFNSFFVAGSHNFRENGTVSDDEKQFYATYGTLLPNGNSAEVGLTQLIPDRIVFGSEKTFCDYTEHVATATYLVAGTTDTYYHSCPICGDAGTRTFKVVDGSYYIVENPEAEGAEITAPTCTADGVYVKSCTCGDVDPDRTNTFEHGILGHDFTKKVAAEQYLFREATCIAPAAYYKICSRCDLSSKGQEGEALFTTVTTLWPEGAVKPVYHGQRTFYTGDSYTVSDGQINMNGANPPSGSRWQPLEDGWVKVTPTAITPVITNTRFNGNSSQAVTAIDSDFVKITPDFNYHVAKSEDSQTIYVAFEYLPKTVDTAINGATTAAIYNYQVYRFGFNSQDYTQQLVVQSYSNGFDASGQTAKVWVAGKDWISSEPIYSGFNGNSPYYEYVRGGDGTSSNAAIRKFSFDVSAISSLWSEKFGVTLTAEDFNSLYVTVSNIYNGDSGSSQWNATYGTVINNGSSAEIGLTNVLPDLIVFGSEKTFCDYTEHVSTETYLVPGTDDTYYHSCPLCGDAGTITYTVVDGSYYTANNTELEGAKISDPTCTDQGVYIKNCTCGALHPNDETFNTPALGHDYSKELAQEQYLKKAATCVVGDIYYKVCSRCDNSSKGDAENEATFIATAPLRWPSGTKGLDHTDLGAYGQDTYTSGSADYYATEGVMAIDGRRGDDEPYYCITPDFVEVDKMLASEFRFYSGKAGSILEDDPSTTDVNELEEAEKYASKYKYYVAEDDEKFYLVLENYAPFNELDGEEGLTEHSETIVNTHYNINVGFDPNNYDRSLYIRIVGTVDASGYPNLYIAPYGDGKYNTLKNDTYKNIITYKRVHYDLDGNYLGENNCNEFNKNDSKMALWVNCVELAFDKELVKQIYKDSNYFGGNSNTDIDFSTMFISVSNINTRYVGSSATYYYPFYGSFFASTPEGLPYKYVPDVVVLGEEKCINGCSFTSHALDYPVDGEENTYYHSCIWCEAKGIRTFKTDAEGNVIYESVANEKTLVPGQEGKTCGQTVEYYKSCPCGFISDEKFEQPLEHNYKGEAIPENLVYGKEATCTSDAVYNQYCTICGYVNEELTWTDVGSSEIHRQTANKTEYGYKAPTCVAFGWNPYTVCECGFSTLEDNKIPAIQVSTSGTPKLSSYLAAGQPIHVTAANVNATPNPADAKVSAGEYSVSYVIDAPAAFLRNHLYNSASATEVDYNSFDAVAKEIADMEKVRYSFAQDEEHFYIAVEHISGESAEYNNQRPLFQYVFTINPGLANQKTIGVISQMQLGTNITTGEADKWANGKVMDVKNITDGSIGNDWAQQAGTRDNWSSFVDANGRVGRYNAIFDAAYAAKRVQNVDGDTSFENYTKETGVIKHPNGWTLESAATTVELVINKAQLASIIGTNVDGLSDVLGFAVSTTTDIQKSSGAAAGSYSTRHIHMLWNGTAYFGENEVCNYASNLNLLPGIVVFGDDSAIGCNFTHVIDDKYKIATDEETGITAYYHSCSIKDTPESEDRGCGRANSSIFYVDAEGNIIYDVKNVNFEGAIKTAPTCEGSGEAYFGCSCGELDPNESTYTAEPLGHKFDDVTSMEYQKSAATCGSNAKYFAQCSVCHVSSEGKTGEKVFEEAGSKEAHIAVVEASGKRTTVPAKEPTCIGIGWNAYAVCSECGYSGLEANTLPPKRWPATAENPAYFGQRVFFASEEYINDADIHMDNDQVKLGGVRWQELEEGVWSCLTPTELEPTIVNQYHAGQTNVTGYTVVDSAYEPITPHYKYYVARSESRLYLAFDMLYQPSEEAIEGSTSVWTSDSPEYYRLGFNPADHTQQMVIKLQHHGLDEPGQESEVGFATATGYTSLWTGYNSVSPYYDFVVGGPSSNTTHRIKKLAFDKEVIKEFWQENFGVTLTDADFNTFYISTSNFYRVSASVTWKAFYGTMISEEQAAKYGVSQLLPDTVVFGNNGYDHPECDYSEHVQDEKYLINTIDGVKYYLHSCSVCGAPSTSVFKVDTNGNILYDCEDVYAEGAEKTAATCKQAGEYYFSCTCGELHTTTFTVPKLEHTWVDDDNNYQTPRVCAVCGDADNGAYYDKPTEAVNILMIGNSFSNYFVEELYGLASAAGYEINVVNLYESGCPVRDHWTWLNDDSEAYELYVTNAAGRKKITSVKTIKGALAYAKEVWGEDWDVISFQQHFYPTLSENADVALDKTRWYAKQLFDYAKDNHPTAELYWHETWPYQVGFGTEGYYEKGVTVPSEQVSTLEQQATMYNTIKSVSSVIVKDNNVNMVPSGDAWVIARAKLEAAGMVDDLCARIGTNGNRGDYYHDGDIGGGQYLNACVWFETLFGEDCTGNPYKPSYINQSKTDSTGTVYMFTEAEMAILQAAAHEAVAVVYGPAYAGHEHIMIEASCTEPRHCAGCDLVEGTALGHQNAQGETLTTYCVDAAEDRYCVRCKTTIYLVHEYGDDDTCDLCGKTRVSWTAPYGTNSYYATDISGNTPTIDGAISDGEYGEAIVVTPALPTTNTSYGDKWETGEVDNTLASENMQYYFSYDADNIYVAIKDPAPALVDGVSQIYRSNYAFYFGFDLNNVTRYFYFAGGATDSAWVNLGAYDNGSKVADLATYDLISEAKIRRKNVTTGEFFDAGDFFSENGNQNCFDGDWELYIEFKMSKQDIIDMMNDVYTTDYTELSNAMWIGMNANGYREDQDITQYFRWLGRNNISDKKGQFTEYGLPETSNRDWLFDLVVFGEEGTVIEVANRYQPHDDCPDGHTLTTYEAKAPTNSAAGWKKYVACSVCGYTTYEEIPMIVDTFEMGYSRVVITPYGYFPIDGKTGVHIDDDGYVDDIYATVAAMYDGETTLLLISIDIGSISETMCDRMRRNINAVTGVPKDNIIIAATHAHSSVSFSKSAQWRSEAFANIANAAAEAISDLSETDIYIGEGKTTGMAWVRRYVNIDENGEFVFASEDHVWPTIDQYNDPTTTTVSEADDTVQIVRFVRADKKDIVATNWQGHLASAVNDYPELISSDIANYMRKDIEKGDTDTQVIFIAGASGNLNLCAPNSTVDTYGSGAQASGDLFYERVAHALATETLRVLNEGLTQIESGKISMIKKTITVRQQNETDEEVAAAQARIDAAVAAGQEPSKIDRSIVARNVSDARTLRVMAVGIGDLGMVVVPYEMFDTNGMQIKEASPYKMTLVITNADGDYAYMPSYQGKVYYGGYDANNSYFRAGTAELLVETYVGMLEELSGPHTWSKWTINTLPTADAEGSATKTCSHCDSVVTVTLPKLDKYHLFEDLYDDADEPAYKSDGTTIFTDVTEIGTAACLYTINDSGIYVFKFADGTTALMTLEYVSIDITWGTMSFIYTNCMWNPEDLEYNIGEWQPAEADANVITIYNSGTVNVNVTFIYVSEDAFADIIGGSFTGVDANGTVEVVAEETENITLELIRKAIPQKGENLSVGTVTITITKAEDAE